MEQEIPQASELRSLADAASKDAVPEKLRKMVHSFSVQARSAARRGAYLLPWTFGADCPPAVCAAFVNALQTAADGAPTYRVELPEGETEPLPKMTVTIRW